MDDALAIVKIKNAYAILWKYYILENNSNN